MNATLVPRRKGREPRCAGAGAPAAGGPLRLSRWLKRGIVGVIVASVAPFAADAQTKLTDLTGDWQGVGTERNSPLESAQPTTCHSKIRSAANHMTNETVCNGQSGLHRVSRLTITLDGDEITGVLDQTSAAGPGASSPMVLKGTVAGRRIDDVATLQIRFPGLMPNATITLKVISPSSYSVQGSTLGISMMDVTYTRVGKH
jgi:hypothetical protein